MRLHFNYLGQKIEPSNQNQIVLGSEKHSNEEPSVLLVSEFLFIIMYYMSYSLHMDQ